jgi:hypothetical protein
MARFAPRAASASAAAKPMPLVAPVIRICLSFTAQQSKGYGHTGDDLFDGQGSSTRPTTDRWSVRTGVSPRLLGIVNKRKRPWSPPLGEANLSHKFETTARRRLLTHTARGPPFVRVKSGGEGRPLGRCCRCETTAEARGRSFSAGAASLGTAGGTSKAWPFSCSDSGTVRLGLSYP